MRRHARTMLALLALVTGTLAAIAGNVVPPPAADEVSAVDLAQWIRDQRPGLLIVDLRTAEAFDRDRLPGARLIADLDADTLRAADSVVVYSDARADGAALRGLSNVPRVLRLHGGIAAWNEEVLFPVIRADASARQQRDFATRAMLSRYFGGSPRLLDPGALPARARSRHGC
ncbi:MAG TPA: rhodanese-like domain-containing protein [Rudaea sp.]|nr:rhodanese-like domain-containing protein [Rudaea sp.]